MDIAGNSRLLVCLPIPVPVAVAVAVPAAISHCPCWLKARAPRRIADAHFMQPLLSWLYTPNWYASGSVASPSPHSWRTRARQDKSATCATVGIRVGSKVGVGDGTEVGKFGACDGDCDGVREGVWDGLCVECVGVRVGAGVAGADVGIFVGSSDGARDGILVGTAECCICNTHDAKVIKMLSTAKGQLLHV